MIFCNIHPGKHQRKNGFWPSPLKGRCCPYETAIRSSFAFFNTEMFKFQFNFDFVEVHRVREFSFRPLGDDTETEDLTDGREESGTRDDDQEWLAGKITSSTARPRLMSVWNVDGELITHPGIDVKYERVKIHSATLTAPGR